MSDQRNLIIAIVLSVGIIFAFQFFYEMPRSIARRSSGKRPRRAQRRRPGRTRPVPPGQAPGIATPGGGAGAGDEPCRRAGAVAADAYRQRRRPRLDRAEGRPRSTT